MKPISAFSLEKHEGPYEKWPMRSRLFLDEQSTGAAIPGYEIEAQYQYGDAYLIITSQDCPFEESNDFLLLDRNFKIIARNQLLVPYGSFLLHAHWPIGLNAIRLHYYERLFYTLVVQEKQGLFGLRHKLKLYRDDEPEQDPRSLASVAELQKQLEEIRNKRASPEDSPTK